MDRMPKIEHYQVWIENLDPRLPRIAFFASRNIKAGEELQFDYKYAAQETNRLMCYCNAWNCRRYLT